MVTGMEVCPLCASCRISERSACMCVNFKILGKKSVVHLGFRVNSSGNIRLTYD